MKHRGKKRRMFLKTNSKVHILKSQPSPRIRHNLVTVHSKVFKDRYKNKKWYYLSKVKWRAVLNVLGFFGIIVGCLYQCGLFLSLYLDYPTTVEFNVANEATLDFPAVTVCNSNPVRYKPWCAEDASVCIRKPNETMEDIRIRHADLYDTLSREHRIRLGNQFDDFLLYAEYEDKIVKNDFTQYYDYEFTNCYTFNSVWGNQSTPVKSAFLFNPVTGTSSELIMCVNIDVSNYGNLTGTVVGRVRLTIHANDIVPNPTYDAATLEAGEFYSYAVQKVTTELLERPYQTSCRNYEKEKEIRTGARMSQKNCLLECFKNETEKMCGCTYRRLSLMYDAAPCELRPQKHCLEVVEEQVFKLCNPQCPMGCKKIEFQFVATDSEPLREESSLYEKMNIVNYFKTADDMHKNMACFRIHYGSTETRTLLYRPKYEFIELFSLLGGYSGLWLGFSLLNCFEFFVSKLIHLKRNASVSKINPKNTRKRKFYRSYVSTI